MAEPPGKPSTPPRAVLVDPLGGGGRFSPLLQRQGWETIAVISSRSAPEWAMRKFRPENYDRVLEAPDDREALAERLAPFSPAAVIAAFETGVELADWLAERLGLPGNGTALSRCRRHKGAMADRLVECGVPCADHVATDDLDVLLEWARGRDAWPVVVKPAESASSDRVSICDSLEQVATAFRSTLGQPNVLGGENRELLGQEFLRGQQYLVNSVSRDGQHRIGEIWKFDSSYEEGIHLYDRQELLDGTGELQDRLVEYALRVLDALGIRQGAGHTEIMVTEAGPILIECAARVTGGINAEALNAAVGYDHISLAVEAVTQPERFLSRPLSYSVRRRLGIVALRSPFEGRISPGPALEELTSLPTFAGCTRPLDPGTRVQRTTNLLTSPGLLYLVGDDIGDVRRDMAAVRRLEASGLLYVRDPEPAIR